MKILHIIDDLQMGGAQRLVDQLLPMIDKTEDITVELLILTDEQKICCQELEKSKIRIDRIPLRNIYHPFNIIYIRNHILHGKFDVVHVHLCAPVYLASIAKRLIWNRRIKFIMTEHNTYNKRRKYKPFSMIERMIYSGYSKVISISNDTQWNLVQWLNVRNTDLHRFCVIENGINITKFNTAAAYPKEELYPLYKEEMKYVVMVARFVEQKDHFTVINALSMLPEQVHLILVGDGPLYHSVYEYVKDRNIIDRVHFLGFRTDVDRIIKTCDIVVISSRWEGFGLVSIEGMAAGKPVVASDVPGLRDIVKDAGLLFPLGNSELLSKNIYDLLSNPDYYDSIIRRSRLRAEQYSIERMAEKYISVYKEYKFDLAEVVE